MDSSVASPLPHMDSSVASVLLASLEQQQQHQNNGDSVHAPASASEGGAAAEQPALSNDGGHALDSGAGGASRKVIDLRAMTYEQLLVRCILLIYSTAICSTACIWHPCAL